VRVRDRCGIRDVRYHMEVLTNFPYEEVTQIFVRVIERRSGRAQRLRCEDPARRTGRHRQVGQLADRMSRARRSLAPDPWLTGNR
jgi:hypothetical protein